MIIETNRNIIVLSNEIQQSTSRHPHGTVIFLLFLIQWKVSYGGVLFVSQFIRFHIHIVFFSLLFSFSFSSWDLIKCMKLLYDVWICVNSCRITLL